MAFSNSSEYFKGFEIEIIRESPFDFYARCYSPKHENRFFTVICCPKIDFISVISKIFVSLYLRPGEGRSISWLKNSYHNSSYLTEKIDPHFLRGITYFDSCAAKDELIKLVLEYTDKDSHVEAISKIQRETFESQEELLDYIAFYFEDLLSKVLDIGMVASIAVPQEALGYFFHHPKMKEYFNDKS